MRNGRAVPGKVEIKRASRLPQANIVKIGIVSRDYGCIYPNGLRDFSYSFPGILGLLDERRCDIWGSFPCIAWFRNQSLIPIPAFEAELR